MTQSHQALGAPLPEANHPPLVSKADIARADVHPCCPSAFAMLTKTDVHTGRAAVPVGPRFPQAVRKTPRETLLAKGSHSCDRLGVVHSLFSPCGLGSAPLTTRCAAIHKI